MTTLDPRGLDAAHKAIWGLESLEGRITTLGYSTAKVVAEQAITAYLDALSSLPAQAVAWRWRFDDSGQWYYSEEKPDTAPATIVQALCLTPSQPAAVGELLTRAATAARIMMEYDAWEVPAPAPADPIDYAWTAQVINDLAAALVHLDQVKL